MVFSFKNWIFFEFLRCSINFFDRFSFNYMHTLRFYHLFLKLIVFPSWQITWEKARSNKSVNGTNRTSICHHGKFHGKFPWKISHGKLLRLKTYTSICHHGKFHGKFPWKISHGKLLRLKTYILHKTLRYWLLLFEK